MQKPFLVRFPVWVLVNVEQIQSGDPFAAVVVGRPTNGERMVLIFSDEWSAQDYSHYRHHEGTTPLAVIDQGTLDQILDEAERNGVTYVGYDPGKDVRVARLGDWLARW